jgi:hypothetical protein
MREAGAMDWATVIGLVFSGIAVTASLYKLRQARAAEKRAEARAAEERAELERTTSRRPGRLVTVANDLEIKMFVRGSEDPGDHDWLSDGLHRAAPEPVCRSEPMPRQSGVTSIILLILTIVATLALLLFSFVL